MLLMCNFFFFSLFLVPPLSSFRTLLCAMNEWLLRSLFDRDQTRLCLVFILLSFVDLHSVKFPCMLHTHIEQSMEVLSHQISLSIFHSPIFPHCLLIFLLLLWPVVFPLFYGVCEHKSIFHLGFVFVKKQDFSCFFVNSSTFVSFSWSSPQLSVCVIILSISYRNELLRCRKSQGQDIVESAEDNDSETMTCDL